MKVLMINSPYGQRYNDMTVEFAEFWAEKILGDLMGEVKQFRLVFGESWLMKQDRDGLTGFRKLWEKDKRKSTVYMGEFVFKKWDHLGWSIIHELCHLRQLLTGELKVNKKSITYMGKRYTSDDWNDLVNEGWERKRQKSRRAQRAFLSYHAPWETVPFLTADNWWTGSKYRGVA